MPPRHNKSYQVQSKVEFRQIISLDVKVVQTKQKEAQSACVVLVTLDGLALSCSLRLLK